MVTRWWLEKQQTCWTQPQVAMGRSRTPSEFDALACRQSAEEVRDMIRLVKPSSVMVELCPQVKSALGPLHHRKMPADTPLSMLMHGLTADVLKLAVAVWLPVVWLASSFKSHNSC